MRAQTLLQSVGHRSPKYSNRNTLTAVFDGFSIGSCASLNARVITRGAARDGKPLRSWKAGTAPAPFNRTLSPSRPPSMKATEQSTNLYNALFNKPYIFGCYLGGIAIITAGFFNHSTIAWADRNAVETKRRLPSYVPVFSSVSTIFLLAIGSYVLFFRV